MFDNTYKEEKEQKLAIVENLNKYKQIMKSNKWKKTEIERGEINRPLKRLFSVVCQGSIYQLVHEPHQPFSALQRLVLESLNSLQP